MASPSGWSLHRGSLLCFFSLCGLLRTGIGRGSRTVHLGSWEGSAQQSCARAVSSLYTVFFSNPPSHSSGLDQFNSGSILMYGWREWDNCGRAQCYLVKLYKWAGSLALTHILLLILGLDFAFLLLEDWWKEFFFPSLLPVGYLSVSEGVQNMILWWMFR